VTDAEFRQIFGEHKDAVYRFAWRMTGSANVAEDVAQDCFLTLLSAPQRYERARAPMRAYLLGITRNIILKRWRAENRWNPLDEDAVLVEPADPASTEIAELIGRAIQSLPPLQREALILAEYEEMTLEDVARAVDAEIGTVKSRLHRARENLRRMLAPLRRSTCNR
jgi:RNA polymerase sigma-70 factor (ECF subfamily)